MNLIFFTLVLELAKAMAKKPHREQKRRVVFSAISRAKERKGMHADAAKDEGLWQPHQLSYRSPRGQSSLACRREAVPAGPKPEVPCR